MTSTNDTTDPNEMYRIDDETTRIHLDGDVLIYDEANHSSWIESTAPSRWKLDVNQS